MKDFFGTEVQVGDIVLTDAIGKSKSAKAVAKISKITAKAIWVKFPAIKGVAWNNEEFAFYAGPARIEHYNQHGPQKITTKEWIRQWFVKLTPEQAEFSRQNHPSFYGDL